MTGRPSEANREELSLAHTLIDPVISGYQQIHEVRIGIISTPELLNGLVVQPAILAFDNNASEMDRYGLPDGLLVRQPSLRFHLHNSVCSAVHEVTLQMFTSAEPWRPLNVFYNHDGSNQGRVRACCLGNVLGQVPKVFGDPLNRPFR